MDPIKWMQDQPNTTTRFFLFLFVFVPGFWLSVAFLISILVGIGSLVKAIVA